MKKRVNTHKDPSGKERGKGAPTTALHLQNGTGWGATGNTVEVGEGKSCDLNRKRPNPPRLGGSPGKGD